MSDDLGHVGAKDRVDEKDARHDHQRRAKRAARGFEKDQEADHRNDEILQDRRADTAGDVLVIDIEVKRGRGTHHGQRPFPGRYPVLGRAEQDRGDDGQRYQRNPPDRRAFLGRDEEQDAKDHRHPDAKRKLHLGARGREGGEGQEDREGEVDGARLGIVEDAEAEHEGDRRGNPDLEQRPRQCDDRDEGADRPLLTARAGVRRCDEFVKLRLAEATMSGGFIFDHGGLLLVLSCHVPP